MSGSSTAVDYGALKIADVTSDKVNQEILQRIKDDDFGFELQVRERSPGAFGRGTNVYIIDNARSMGVLGHYLGRRTQVSCLTFILPSYCDDIIEPFLFELQNNRSIRALEIVESDIPRGFFRTLTPFIANNPDLTGLHVMDCAMDADQYRSLSLALKECKYLEKFSISDRYRDSRYRDEDDEEDRDEDDEEEAILSVIEALKMHTWLEDLTFRDSSLGRDACLALLDLLRRSSELQILDLEGNDINDLVVEALVGALAHCRKLQELSLGRIPSIGARGYRALSTLLEDPNSRLKSLSLEFNGINDESAIIIANALTRNNTLEELYIGYDADSWETNITSKGWAAFAKVLCDTISVNNTFLSNHTLQIIDGEKRTARDFFRRGMPGNIASLLSLNEQDDKTAVAFTKVLQHHDDIDMDFDMQPLFEWDLKALPDVIDWFERAAAYEIESEDINQKRKLAAIYKFIRGMPELAIDGITGASTKSGKVGGEKRPHSTAFEG